MANIYENAEKQEDGRYRMRESITLDKNSMVKKLPLSESVILNEEKFSPKGAYRFKIWEVGKFNLNGRCYDRVIEQVINGKKATLGFANHPLDEGDVTKTFSVAKNPQIVEGWMTADFYLVGKYGELAEEILERGGPIGVSSSALGELDGDGYVLSENFELERYGDWVDVPSNNYYHTKDETYIEESQEESIGKNVTIINNENLHKGENLNEEHIMSDNVKKLQEKTLELNVRQLLTEANKTDDPYARLNELMEIKSVVDDADLKGKVVEGLMKSISETEATIKTFAEKGMKFDETNEELSKTQEAHKGASEELEALKEEKAKLDELSEASKKVIEDLKEDISKAKKELEEIKGQAELSEKKANILERERDEAVTKIAQLMTEQDEEEEVEDEEEGEEEPKEEGKKKEAVLDDEGKPVIEESSKEEAPKDADKVAISEKKKGEIAEARKNRNKAALRKMHRKMEKTREQKMVFTETSKVLSFYRDAVRQNPELRTIKEAILACKTVEDAQILALRQENLNESRIRSKEIAESRKPSVVKKSDDLKLNNGLW